MSPRVVKSRAERRVELLAPVPYRDGTQVPVSFALEDGWLVVRFRDAAGELFGGKVEEDASEEHVRDVAFDAVLFVAERLNGVPRVEGLDGRPELRDELGRVRRRRTA